MSTFFEKPKEAGGIAKNTDVETVLDINGTQLRRLSNAARELAKLNKAVEPYVAPIAAAADHTDEIAHNLANAIAFKA